MNIEALAWILFFLSGILYIVGYLPGLRAMYIDKSVEGVSQFFWELVLTTVSFSFYTLIVTGADIVNIVVVGCNMFLALVMLAWKNMLRYRAIGILYTMLYIVVNLMVYFMFGIPLHILQSIATLTIILAYVDQIIRFAVRKTAIGTSPLLYFILGMAILFLILNLILTHAYIHVIITEAVNLILIMICFFMCMKYRA
ncbi:hypothetical protein HOT02_gp150 [Staphylococcus phage phiSA_BS2]|uniref:Uncharacterized protein n=1 Tax=Staphylococcus phage phiSA_BS2 TaxID=2126724 RepID=A0A2R3ZXZ8_9CAUD|nr:hypothetical protein HOT02_gp150 [Staphylococcus phage phiSA_BS2]AVR55594.1 hypothetical protein phiSABS2_150 [Staphylococcus phage phiSA_BS2]